MEYSDKEAAEGLKAGDTVVFEWLFRKYYAQLCLYANRFLAGPQNAEEIVSETFAVLWEKKDRIQFSHSVRGYLFGTVHHKCINALEHLKVRNRYEEWLITSARQSGQDEIPEQDLIEKEMTRDIEKAIEDLPEKCRQIFKLSRFEQKKYHEIAAILQLSPKTVETQMRIALEKLRQSLRHLLTLFIW